MPNLSDDFFEFSILGLLLDGQVPGQILRDVLRKDFGWEGVDHQFFVTVSKLERRGLIAIHKYISTSRKRTRQESCYEITEPGQGYWKSTFGLFLNLCDRWKSRATSVPDFECPIRPSESLTEPIRIRRLPNAQEIESIKQKAPREFAVILRLAMAIGQDVVELSAVEISDIDTDAWTLRLAQRSNEAVSPPPCIIPIPQDCHLLISNLVGERRTGPLFMTAFGLPWQVENLRMCWTRVKQRLKFPSEVVMPSTMDPENWTRK